METLSDFARGPLFRLTFAIMVLGLARVLLLDIIGVISAYRKAGDRTFPWRLAVLRTLEWLVPIRRVIHRRPYYSIFAILFHVGLILVPLFLYAHVELWKDALGFGWYTLTKPVADWLTISTIVFGSAILIGRIVSRNARHLSRKQDYLWPPILIVPFVTGYICANWSLSASTYEFLILVHVLSAELIFVLIPFTKIAHCVIMPLSQLVMIVAWKFPARVDEDVCTTLGKKGAPV